MNTDVERTGGLRWRRGTVVILFVAFAALSCGKQKAIEPVVAAAHPIGTRAELRAPLGLPPVPFSTEYPPTPESIALGRRLFHDVRLSAGDQFSCASCHKPNDYFADARAVASGAGGALGKRNTPTLLNAVYHSAQFWDGRAATLEAQVGGPMANPIEMNQPHEVAVARLNADAAYREEFARVFGPGPVTMPKIERAVADFERTLLSGNSPFDRYQFGGDKTALSASAVRGLAVFTDKNKGNCSTCHTIEQKFALFTDGKFHNLGVGMNAEGELTDVGRFEHTRVEADRGAFRTPTLRNIAHTAPYMHDGSLKTLKEVVDFYVGGGSSNPQLDREIKPLNLTAQERADLVTFLESLTGEVPPDAGTKKTSKE